jgi:putative peptidoglycan lipid II flippase
MVFMLAAGARKIGDVARFDARFRQRIWRIVIASIGMGVVLFGLNASLGQFLFMDYVRYPALAVLIILGSLSYFAFGQMFGAFSFRELSGALRRRKSGG